MSNLALNLIRENKKIQDSFLDLTNCGLTELPDELFDCVWLTGLNLGPLYYESKNSTWIKSKNSGPGNRFSPSALQQLKKLTGLQSLYLRNSQITDIRFLKKLTSLQSLDLGGNRITDYNFLEDLTSLQSLDLSNSQITDIRFLKRLTSLQSLYLSENRIEDIHFLEKLTSLQSLDLSFNQISDIRILEKLTSLQNLDLSDNRITDFSFLKELSDLHRLYLRFNQISDIRFLEKLTGLQSLDLSDNRITDISRIIPLLKRRNLVGINLDKFTLNLKNNPLNTPPLEIVQQGNKAILSYFSELEKQGKDYLYEAKMLIVGQPRAGKTSLRYKLFDQKAALPLEADTTRGIDIRSLEFDIIDRDNKPRKFKCNIWDFAGQQISYATHQFFLTNRSLYVLVMDTGKDSVGGDDSTMNYWLQVVELLGGNSPMLLLLNQKNERPFTADLSQKKIRFAFLKKEYRVDLNSLIPGTNSYKEDQEKAFNELREDVKIELKRLPLIGFPMPKSWVKIREELKQLSLKKPYISQQDYIKICETHDVEEYEQQRELSRVFQDLGVFLHFQEHPALEEFIILQNDWATDAVFAVLDNPEVKAQRGRFTDGDLAAIWRNKDYEPGVHRRLLELMKQFELCYQVENSSPREYIIPEMLDERSPVGYEWIPQNDLPLQYHYDFMPKGILTRLIVRLHRHIVRDKNDQLVWKSGVKIDGTSMDCPNTFAEIAEAWDNKQVLIRVQGKFPKDLMSKLTYEIDSINTDFFKQVSRDPASQKSKWYKMIPCNCRTCKDSTDKHFYDYGELLERKEYGKATIECKLKPYEAVSINELLDGVFSERAIRQKANERLPSIKSSEEKHTKNVFISYSHEDLIHRDAAKKYLVNLESQELIKIWHDKGISPGEIWDDKIKSKLNEADIIILLVSQNFIASPYIQKAEMRIALDNKAKGKSIIIPFLLDTCDWRNWKVIPSTKTEDDLKNNGGKMGNYQFLPLHDDDQRLVPLSDKKLWPNESVAWMKLVDYIKGLLT